MLAYVLWHWPFAEVEVAAYEEALLAFHRSLATSGADGFERSAVFRSEGAPWLGAARRGYEDWYLLDGSYALDPLNEAAVAELRKATHDAVAGGAAGFAAGLYGLRAGEPTLEQARSAVWLAKPRGTAYEEFYARLEPWTNRPGESLWRRHMVLGPTTEFCLLGGEEPGLPADLVSVTTELSPLGP